jgi:hypothetical protein
MFYLYKHIDASTTKEQSEAVTDVVWQYENELDAIDAADYYNSSLAMAGVPSWVCCYFVGSR